MAINAIFSADFSDFVRGVKQADGSLETLKVKTVGSTTAIGGLHQGLSQVDRILASLGINIGPQVRALEEMATVSGKTAAQLGKVGTAAAVVAAGFAGWSVGRWIADLTGMDEKVASLADRLFGLGLAEQTAGARLDVLARATKIAGQEITNYNEALAIIKKSNEDFAESVNTSAHRVSQWQAEIRKVRANGDLDALARDLEQQNGSLKQLSAQYGISVEALQHYVRYTKDADEATKRSAETQAKAATDLRAFRNLIAEREIEDHKRALDQQEKDEKEYRDFQNWVGERQMEDEAARMKQREEEHAAMLARMAAAEAAFIGLTITGQGFGGGALATGPALPTTPFGSTGLGGGGVTVFGGDGGPVATGTGVMVHPSIGGLGRGGMSITNHISVVDTQENLARSIGRQIAQSVARGTKFS